MHLNSPDVDLQTHINDVVNLVLFEDLKDVVLTGHSYGGMVITGVMNRIPGASSTWSSWTPRCREDGQSIWDIFGSAPPLQLRPLQGRLHAGAVGQAGRQAAAQRQAQHQVLQPAGVSQKPGGQRPSRSPTAFVPKRTSRPRSAPRPTRAGSAASRGWTIRFPGGHVAPTGKTRAAWPR